jgi:phosphonate transport system permease protein
LTATEFKRKTFSGSGSRLKRTSFSFLFIALLCLLVADIEVIPVDPWFELGRIGWGLITPDFFATEALLDALINTIAFALLGVVISNFCGFSLALIFHWRPIRLFCAFIRSIHELFWALIFLQLFGLSTLTAVLAIAIPYTGIFAKVYAEILEESDQSAWEVLPSNSSWLSAFAYARLPAAIFHFKTYSLYRMECAIRSSAVLGFIGLPTLGFHLETAFSQGLYSQAGALLYLFFVIIATLRHWMKLKLVPLYLLGALYWLPGDNAFSWDTLVRFFTWDIIPAPLRQAEQLDLHALQLLSDWCLRLFTEQAGEGIFNTLVLTMIALVSSGLLALLLFPLISSLFFRRSSRNLGHASLVIFRSTPELLLAYLGLLVLGPSMLPAIWALSVHNGAIIGHLIGRYSETLTLRADAPKGLNLYVFEVAPRIYRQFLAFLFYRWEVIMRETAILGILGIHTLGFYIDSAFEDLRFDRALYLILITALLNLFIDQLSRLIRARLHLGRLPDQANC